MTRFGLTWPAAGCNLLNTAHRPMKPAFVLLGAATLLAGSAFGQADVIIKKRAQEIRDQNNVQQGVTPPSQPAQPATTPATSAAPTPVQQSVAKLRTDLTAIKGQGEGHGGAKAANHQGPDRPGARRK